MKTLSDDHKMANQKLAYTVSVLQVLLFIVFNLLRVYGDHFEFPDKFSINTS